VKLVAGMLLAICLLAAACGSPGVHLATRDGTEQCLRNAGVRTGGSLDFVATTATGGGLKAHPKGNEVTLVFGETVADADNINDAYHRFHAKNVGIDDVLFQQGNVVMLWRLHPSNAEQALINDCLT
jgi:hypothetical protein